MRSWLSLAFSKKGPPSDAELYSNLDASFLAYVLFPNAKHQLSGMLDSYAKRHADDAPLSVAN